MASRLKLWVGAALVAASAVLSASGALLPLDHDLRDLRFSLETRPATGQIAFVDIDPRSLEQVGVWPWPRALHAQMLDSLMALGADEVMYDVDFSAASDEANDAAFEAALADAGGYARLAAFRQMADASGAALTNVPLPRFAALSEPVGVNVALDSGGKVRAMPLSLDANGTLYPSMAAALAGATPVPGAMFDIDYSILAADVPRISAGDLLAGKVPEAAISGRKVVIGASALELRDLFVVPRQGLIPGAVVQILAAETLLQGRALLPAPFWLPLAALLMLTAVPLLLSRRIGLMAAATGGALLVAEAGAALLQLRYGLLLDTVGIDLGLLAALASTIGLEMIERGRLHRKATRERDSVRKLLDRVIADNFDGVLVVDEASQVIAASRLAAELFGTELAGAGIARLPPALRREIERGFITPPTGVIAEIEVDGRLLEYTVTRSEIGSAGERRRAVCFTFRDITERRRNEQRLAYFNRHDALTGALTRRALAEAIDARTGQPVVVLLLNLTRFRAINEALGHAVGDELLKQLVVRARGMGLTEISRLGGDSFAFTLAAPLDAEAARLLAESLLAVLTAPYQVGEHRPIVGGQIGVALGSGADSADTLLRQADMALNGAKAGGAPVALFRPGMDEAVQRRRDMEVSLRQAIANGGLHLNFQAQVALAGGRVTGAESLVRWTDPVLGRVSPAEFVTLAEETGLIVELGAFVIDAAIAAAAGWPAHLRIALNVSPLQFELDDVPARIEAALARHGLDPQRLDVEITEGMFMAPDGRMLAALARLRALGIGIAIDDFGTGYSSLSYLSTLPVDKLKIDQSFVRGLPADTDSLAIVRAIAMLALSLGKHVVAEGVETTGQSELLRLAGCHTGQGYLYSKPVPEAEFLALAAATTDAMALSA